MNIVIEKINFEEALRYLGAGGKEISPEMRELLVKAEKELLDVAKPKVTYKKDGNEIVFAGTLGVGVDKLIQKKQVSDMAAAVMIDGLASAMIEQVLDEFEEKLRLEIAEESTGAKTLGPRFSPGYGDFPLEAQSEIIKQLDAEKKIGLTLTKGGMLSPVKSVTGIMRIYLDGENYNIDLENCSGCDNCKMKDTCSLRREKA